MNLWNDNDKSMSNNNNIIEYISIDISSSNNTDLYESAKEIRQI